jgi:hypothetical protein
MTREEWQQIAFRRLNNILDAHVVANARTLENKISDAGPTNQRVQPHILTEARKILENRGDIRRRGNGIVWFYLANTPPDQLEKRLAAQKVVHDELLKHTFTVRLGQVLEIAVYRALLETSKSAFFGGFTDLDAHDDSILYHKEEPPSLIKGALIPDGKRLDFLIVSDQGCVGVETKNVREWLYPRSAEIRDLLLKCCAIDAIPVLVARRIPYVTARLLSAAGVIVHEVFNQLFPLSDADLADLARDKNLLGYHDIRIGNDPDARLIKFFGSTLPTHLAEARERFDKAKDLLSSYAAQEMSYPELSSYLTALVHKQSQ